MFRVSRISMSQYPGASAAGETWRRIQTQPSWITRAASVAFVLVLAVPILLLALVALVVAVVVFFVLVGYRRLVGAFRGVLPDRDGRENVRVIQRRE